MAASKTSFFYAQSYSACPKHMVLVGFLLLAMLLSFPINKVYSKNVPLAPQNIPGNIKTVKIYKTGWELSEPIIELGSNESVTLGFDDLSDETTSYSYSIIHCTKDWKESDISPFDYREGFEYHQITDYENSTGTLIPYTHYQLKIPNDDIKLKISGNYIIRVVDTYDYSKIFFETCFMVVEPLLAIQTSIIQPSGLKRTTSQQLNLSFAIDNLNVKDPNQEVYTYVFQNGQKDSRFFSLKPVFVDTKKLDYSSADGLIFDGVNEFLTFDTKSTRYISPEIQNIFQQYGEFSVLLKPDENRSNQRYTYDPDINGKYLVKLDQSEHSEYEADYEWVYFTLPCYEELVGKEVYVYGAFSEWECKPEFLMHYNIQRQAYELRLQFKQGYYNYRYVVKDIKSGMIDQTYFEGNHFDTENDYLILVYLRQFSTRYDRLVGLKRFNTRNPI